MSNSSKYHENARIEVADLLPKQYSRVLEIGCGSGGFRSNLDQEHEYWGVEPVKSVARLAQEKLDKVLTGTYQEVESLIPNTYFDLVICNDVIEHMKNHDEFFQSIRGKINEGGCLVASIPNVRYIGNLRELLIKKDWQYKDSGILDRTHLRFFTRKSLLRTLKENSFSIEHITGINSYQTDSLGMRFFYLLSILVLGDDIKYSQFAIRIQRAQSSI